MAATKLRVAICHVSPVFLDARQTTQKAISLIHQAAKNTANLVVFPETYIPAFPVWSALLAPHQNHDFFHRMVQESVYADGAEVRAIRAAAREAGVLVNVGISEKSRHSTATLYNSNLLIGTNGEVLVHHRKLMPTFFEKLTWSPGDGHGLRVAKTQYGNIGTLICGENTNPLARYALMTESEQVHISTWPGIWPTRVQTSKSETSGNSETTSTDQAPSNTASSSDLPSDKPAKAKSPANYDNVAANRIRAAAHCFEAKCFGVVSAGLFDDECARVLSSYTTDPATLHAQLAAAPQAPSMFLDPTGAPLRGFTIDPSTHQRTEHEYLRATAGILYADLDLSLCVEGKQYHDVTGGYQRLDVFELKVDRRRRDPVTFVE